MKDKMIDDEWKAQQPEIDKEVKRRGLLLVNKMIERARRSNYTMEQWLKYQHLCEMYDKLKRNEK